jgi:hypothetical protein
MVGPYTLEAGTVYAPALRVRCQYAGAYTRACICSVSRPRKPEAYMCKARIWVLGANGTDGATLAVRVVALVEALGLVGPPPSLAYLV